MLSAPAPSGDIPVQCSTCLPFPGQDERRDAARYVVDLFIVHMARTARSETPEHVWTTGSCRQQRPRLRRHSATRLRESAAETLLLGKLTASLPTFSYPYDEREMSDG